MLENIEYLIYIIFFSIISLVFHYVGYQDAKRYYKIDKNYDFKKLSDMTALKTIIDSYERQEIEILNKITMKLLCDNIPDSIKIKEIKKIIEKYLSKETENVHFTF